ncbi:MAG: leucyl/phenylalanyl-tRNA--protein transferase [Desulfobacteraceae bacterium]|nr:leucyl/phenylalanyl-tRNA--protein transferase [Desulfobacteraceae bacterium]
MPVFLLSDPVGFPPPHLASDSGLLAVGGDLHTERLLTAYAMGIFPWYSRGEPILWWSPDPRLVLYPSELHISRRLQRTMRQSRFEVTVDRDFDAVIRHCADAPRAQGPGTWIVEEMIGAYRKLHAEGYAHSVEAWRGSELAGGLYGVCLGHCFFGESMFARIRDASKVAFVHLVRGLHRKGCRLIDCQVTSEHLKRLGAREIPRSTFLRELKAVLNAPTFRGPWADAEFQLHA